MKVGSLPHGIGKSTQELQSRSKIKLISTKNNVFVPIDEIGKVYSAWKDHLGKSERRLEVGFSLEEFVSF